MVIFILFYIFLCVRMVESFDYSSNSSASPQKNILMSNTMKSQHYLCFYLLLYVNRIQHFQLVQAAQMHTGPSEELLLHPNSQVQTNIPNEALKNNAYSSEWPPNAQNIHDKLNGELISNALIGTAHKQEEILDISILVKHKGIESKIKQHADKLLQQQPGIERIYQNTSTTKNQSDQISSEVDRLSVRMSRPLLKSSTKSVLQHCFKRPLIYENELSVACKHFSFERKLVHISSSQSILIQQRQLRTADIQKICIFAETVLPKKFKFELFHKAEKYVFGVELRRELYLLPQHYIWFAKIINAKLSHKGFKLQSQNLKANQLKQSSIFCEGNIYKRSKYMKKWQQRYIVITAEGLFSYKNRNESYSIFISMKDVISLQTQFEVFEANLIITMHCLKQKLQFAIPIHDFCLKISSNWLLAFYRLIMEHKYHLKILRQ